MGRKEYIKQGMGTKEINGNFERGRSKRRRERKTAGGGQDVSKRDVCKSRSGIDGNSIKGGHKEVRTQGSGWDVT